MGAYLYLVGLACLIVAFVIGRGSGHSFRARDISNSEIANGDVTQTVSHQPVPPKPAPDRVAWVIGIVGVLIAAAQLVHDLLK